MNRIFRGAIVAVTTTGLMLGASEKRIVIAQVPSQNVVSVEENIEKDAKNDGNITLLPNPIIRSNQNINTSVQAFAVQTETKQKIAFLTKEREARVKEEKVEEKKRKQRLLAKKKAVAEAKRRKEIRACCGVSAGNSDQRVLERIVEAEAGGENIKGRILVANVILNRVKSKSFPSTVKGVVFAHRGSRYQFSPLSDGRYYSVHVSEGTKKAVKAALNGNNPSCGALYFMERAYADSSNVSWFDRALTRLFRYGCHEFFK